MVVSLFAALYCTGILDKFVRHTINHVDKYYAFPSHFCLTMCSAGDNYAHARAVDTRLFSLRPLRAWVRGYSTHYHIIVLFCCTSILCTTIFKTYLLKGFTAIPRGWDSPVTITSGAPIVDTDTRLILP